METIVLILVQNEEKTVERALQSVINQGEDVEVYLVDDASTDETLGIALSVLAKSDLDFRVQMNKSKMGIVESAASAFKVFSDRDCFLIRLDGDDELPPDAIKNLKKAWKPDSFVAGSYIEVQKNKSKTIFPKTIYGYLAGGVLMRIKDIVDVGGLAENDVGIFIEYDLYARLIEGGYYPIYTKYPTYIYYRHSGSITTNKLVVKDSLESLRVFWGNKLVSQIRRY